MQDENTTQPADSSTDGSLPEPPLSLSTNPSDTQAPADDSSAISTDSGETQPAEAAAEETSVAVESPADTTVTPTEDSAPDTTPAASPVSGDLETIKSSVLEELAPIVDELDQEPEERYRTLMMVIQASDNQELVKEAYEAAQKIEDKKAKAEALLNILNEINYFTGKGEKSEG